jgi:hypothetical protein
MHERFHLIPKQHIATSLPTFFKSYAAKELAWNITIAVPVDAGISAMLSAIFSCYAKLGGVKQR